MYHNKVQEVTMAEPQKVFNAANIDRSAPPMTVKVGSKYVGYGHPTFVIAEIGNNHNGEIGLAHDMIRAASLAGADAVKFQKRTVENVFTRELLGKPQTHSTNLGTTYEA